MVPSLAPGLRAGTMSPDDFASHAIQWGHQEPGVSFAVLIQPSSVSPDLGFEPVQYWYLTLSGGLMTPAMWPEPARTNSTGPENNCAPLNTDTAGAI